MTRILLLRHAPPLTGGRLAGRTEVDADVTDHAAFTWIRTRIGAVERVISSPARRCLQTAEALGLSPDATHDAFREQHYGAWEGMAYEDLPDLGRLEAAALARHRPEGGESFEDMAARVCPEIEGLRGEVLVICHAGVIRAALSLVVGSAALSFSIAPLSLTILQRQGDDWSVEAVNVTAP